MSVSFLEDPILSVSFMPITAKSSMELAMKNTNYSSLPHSEWLTTGHVARYLHISPSTLEKARCTGKGEWAGVPYHKIGRSVRYKRSEVTAFIDQCRISGNCA